MEERIVMTDFEVIAAAALALPEEQREDLLDRLLVSLDGPADEDVEQAWDAEIARRLEEVESGKEKGIPWEEVRRQLREDADGDAR
jgi:putative addiction module component (TIGR02574 family)